MLLVKICTIQIDDLNNPNDFFLIKTAPSFNSRYDKSVCNLGFYIRGCNKRTRCDIAAEFVLFLFNEFNFIILREIIAFIIAVIQFIPSSVNKSLLKKESNFIIWKRSKNQLR